MEWFRWVAGLSDQLVSHKHITVDGKVVNIPSFSVKPGQIVGTVSTSAFL